MNPELPHLTAHPLIWWVEWLVAELWLAGDTAHADALDKAEAADITGRRTLINDQWHIEIGWDIGGGLYAYADRQIPACLISDWPGQP